MGWTCQDKLRTSASNTSTQPNPTVAADATREVDAPRRQIIDDDKDPAPRRCGVFALGQPGESCQGWLTVW